MSNPILPGTEVADEKVLVAGLRAGVEKAFADVYLKYHRQLYAIALKYLKEESLAEDVVQDIFIKLWAYRENLREDLSLKGFLITSVRNLVLNTIRNKKTEIVKHLEVSQKTEHSRNSIDQDLTLAEYEQIAEKGISQLSPARQTIFRLRSLQGLNNEEVSTQLGLSINTVKFQYSQASKFLRDYLRQQADI